MLTLYLNLAELSLNLTKS